MLDTSPSPSWDLPLLAGKPCAALTPVVGSSCHSAPWRPNLATDHQHMGPTCWHLWLNALVPLAHPACEWGLPCLCRAQRPGTGLQTLTVLFTGEETEA